ncbi:hypothetical protein KBZ14_07525 [Synechococcus sp. HJ21-Hayes]|uniref:hypothetical protein n=1 Tax=unclassified Synechococcus TaxID=2626047 RepID=UPI0020CCAB86|nr:MULTISPECIES: hypothetical protein [unclassified Synechococcus]MCP9831412.1 hypothetical protein [Synechococcus sp. JJ3a-Johnson]MCP9852719.1 hypothetical protein [Synechococcus sp. HJ21-Hayes]
MTTARIGYVAESKAVVSCYHHYDGYPQWLGRILASFYCSFGDVKALIDGGDMQCCFSNTDFEGCIVLDEFGAPSRIWTPLYYSERGSGEFGSMIHKDLDDFLGYCGFGRGVHLHKERLEFAYLYADEKWTCYDIFKDQVYQAPFDSSATDAAEHIIRKLDLYERIDGELKWQMSL